MLKLKDLEEIDSSKKSSVSFLMFLVSKEMFRQTVKKWSKTRKIYSVITYEIVAPMMNKAHQYTIQTRRLFSLGRIFSKHFKTDSLGKRTDGYFCRPEHEYTGQFSNFTIFFHAVCKKFHSRFQVIRAINTCGFR